MIRKLFSQRLLPVLGLLLAGFTTIAQTTEFKTSDPNNGGVMRYFTTNINSVRTDYITFDVENNNPCPVRLTDLSALHFGQLGTPVVSSNGFSYELYVNYTNVTGAPAGISAAQGWILAATSKPINTGALNTITQIFTGLEVNIPPLSRARFCYRCTGPTFTVEGATPTTFTGNGITFFSGSSTNHFVGTFPGAGLPATSFTVTAPTPPITTFNFIGTLKFVQLPPAAYVDLANKPAIKCVGGSVTLKATSNAAPGGVYTWRDALGNILAQNATGTHTINNLQFSDAGRYFVTYFQCGKESLPDSATLVINNPPAPTVSGKFDYCLNEQFEPITINGTSPKWYYTPSGGSPVPVTPTINTASPNTLIYYVTQTDAWGCESQDRTLIRFRAAARPAAPIVNTPVYYCEEAIPDPLFAVGDSLRWYYFPTGGVATEIAPLPNTSVNDSSEFYVTQTVDGCESDRSRIDVVVTFKPNGMILTDLDNVCQKDSVTIGYFGSAFEGSQYNWGFPQGGVTMLTELDQDSIRVRIDSFGKRLVTLRVGSKGCLSDLYTAEISASPLPYGEIAAKSDACLAQPELIESRNYTPELDSFIWDFDGGLTQHATTEQGPYGIYWHTPGEKYIKVTFVNNGCIDYAYDTIMVHPKPSATILATQDVFSNAERRYVTVDYKEGDAICSSDSLKVSPEVIEPGAKYKWTPTRFFDTYSDLPVTYARVDFKSHLYLEVEDVYGCKNKDSLKVETKSCCEMLFPNAFTPNGDGKNDYFHPIKVGNREVETFRIVNRYGQAVYESKTGNSNGWDGTFKGQPADVGTYFYLISFMCEKEKVDQGGEVILVR